MPHVRMCSKSLRPGTSELERGEAEYLDGGLTEFIDEEDKK